MTTVLNGARISASGAKVTLHDTTHSPVGLWQLDGDLTDSSGNGYTLTVASGSELYAPVSSSHDGFRFNGSTYLVHNVEVSALAMTGDMTIEALVMWLGDPPGYGVNTDTTCTGLVAHGGAGETEALNTVYSFGGRPSAGGLTWVSESGTGTNAQYNYDVEIPTGVLHHLAAVRDSNVVSVYLNGALLGSSGTLTTPTGGADGRLVLGALSNGSAENPTCVMASVKLIGSALTAAQVQAEYRRTLG